MNRFYPYLVTAALLLAGCAGPGPGCTGDPVMCELQAQAAQTRTAQVRAEQDAAATATVAMQIGRNQQEIDQAQARLDLLRAENAEMDRRATATVAAFALAVQQSTATAQAFAGRITQEAIVQRATAEAQSDRRADLWYGNLLPAAVVILVSGVFLAAIIWAWNIRKEPVKWISWKRRVIPLPMGLFAVITIDEQGKEHIEIVDPSKMIDGKSYEPPSPSPSPEPPPDDGFRQITPTVYSSPVPHTDMEMRNRVLQLVRDSAKVAPGHWQARTFPRWDKIGWNAGEHSTVMGILEAMGIVRREDRRGTFLVGYNCLADLDTAITRGKIRITTPHPTAGD